MAEPALALKIIVLGEAGVGKTSVIGRFVNGTFDDTYKATVGFAAQARDIQVGSETYRLDVWDTVGSERFRSVAPNYYRGSDGCVLVYDVTQPKTIEALGYWYDEFSSVVNTGFEAAVPVLILGNKADLPHDDSAIRAALFLKETHDFSEHCLVSALTGASIEDPFVRLAGLCAKSHSGDPSSFLMLKGPNANTQKRGCC
jgi:small GTP-binding protein